MRARVSSVCTKYTKTDLPHGLSAWGCVSILLNKCEVLNHGVCPCQLRQRFPHREEGKSAMIMIAHRAFQTVVAKIW